jgi:hypothetical protein
MLPIVMVTPHILYSLQKNADYFTLRQNSTKLPFMNYLWQWFNHYVFEKYDAFGIVSL